VVTNVSERPVAPVFKNVKGSDLSTKENKSVTIRNVVAVNKRLRRTIKRGLSVSEFMAYGLSAS
jgi:hypothetical protein